jgi:hypothetical protein
MIGTSRRLLLTPVLAVLLALGTLVVPASAAPATPSGVQWHAPPAAVLTSNAANLATIALPMQTLYHQDGFAGGQKCWYNSGNGRTYCLVASAYIAHSGSVWHPETFFNCTRSYGGTTVNTPCNWDLRVFQGLMFTSSASAPSAVYTRDPDDPKCKTGGFSVSGQDRPETDFSPWVLARMGGVTARFLTSTGCNHVHLTNNYHVGSARVQLLNHSEAYDPNYTGLRAI